MSRDVSPFARRRDERVRRGAARRRRRRALARGHQRGRRARDRDQGGQAVHGLLPLSPQLARGAAPRPARGAAVDATAAVGARQGQDPVAGGARARAGGERPGARRGARGAREALDRFLDGPVREYADNHDALGRDRTSRLSPYLHFGCLSVRAIEERLPRGDGPEAFRRQLCWRDFHHHVLLHFPRNARSEFQDRYRGSIRWSYARKPFEAWCEGRTGYPLVDAGMRQLRREGWMHNRARLVVGSFLTKDLGIDWRWGERWFMRLLIDGDEANNNGNWQWIASVGTDPQPAFRRIYNPARHQERYDPENAYVRRYVPELRAGARRVPARAVDDAGGGPARGRMRDRPGLSGADRRPRQAREEALERYRTAEREPVCSPAQRARTTGQPHRLRRENAGRSDRASDAPDGGIGHRGDDPRVARLRGRGGRRGRHGGRGLDRQDRRRGPGAGQRRGHQDPRPARRHGRGRPGAGADRPQRRRAATAPTRRR